jgi:DNA-binding MarR family transcriptional regulator
MGDMTETPWLSDEEQRMWRGFQSMWRTLDRTLERDLMEGAALSGADFSILVPLSEAPGQRLRARDLGRFLDWDRSRLSHQIRRMEQRELVARSNCPTDARGTIIGLTKRGWATLQHAAPGHVQAVRSNFFDVLTEADVVALDDICGRVNDRIASLNLDQGTCTEVTDACADATTI